MITPFIIGISGGTASGKTTLANRLVQYFGQKASFISLDYYYKDHEFGKHIDFSKINFDSPKSIDIELFVRDLWAIRNGNNVKLPQYNFITHRREKDTLQLQVTPVVIVEGLFLFNTVPDFKKIYDLKIFTDVPDDIRFIRRLQRDLTERGRSVETIIQQYLSTVRPMHQKYVLPNKVLADFVYRAGNDHQHAFLDLLEMMNKMVVLT